VPTPAVSMAVNTIAGGVLVVVADLEPVALDVWVMLGETVLDSVIVVDTVLLAVREGVAELLAVLLRVAVLLPVLEEVLVMLGVTGPVCVCVDVMDAVCVCVIVKELVNEGDRELDAVTLAVNEVVAVEVGVLLGVDVLVEEYEGQTAPAANCNMNVPPP
jgi:hypothetical protein